MKHRWLCPASQIPGSHSAEPPGCLPLFFPRNGKQQNVAANRYWGCLTSCFPVAIAMTLLWKTQAFHTTPISESYVSTESFCFNRFLMLLDTDMLPAMSLTTAGKDVLYGISEDYSWSHFVTRYSSERYCATVINEQCSGDPGPDHHLTRFLCDLSQVV